VGDSLDFFFFFFFFFFFIYKKKNVKESFHCPNYISRKMLDLQQLYNNPSHEGESHILGPTLM
jgi:hypothetical protein